MVLFTIDPELHILLPAPGFPQTLPAAWHELVSRSSCAGEATSALGRAVRIDDRCTVVFAGEVHDGPELAEVLGMMPLIGALLCNEMALERAADLSGMAEQSVREAELLSRHLDEARRELQTHWRELKKAKQLAEKSSRAKSEFVANMSHELRTPVHGVLGMVELISRGPLTAQQREDLAIIRACCASLLTIIQDVLDFSRIEAGAVELERIPFSLLELLRAVCAAHQKSAADKGISLQYHAPEENHRLLGDPHRLSQILHNLLSNAVKFTSEGGVVLKAESFPSTDSRIHLEISVEDTGIGIDSATVPRLFEPFQQADSSTTRRFGGSGLGLSICKHLVELMGGSVRVQSAQGKGSCFCILVSFDPAPPEEEPGPATDVEVGSRKILLAEDNPLNIHVMSRLLEQSGHVVVAAKTGLKALELWRQESFDIILMDLQMPEMDGIDAIRHIRAEEVCTNRPPTPIIALTAAARTEDRERCLSEGANAYLPKPVPPGHLENTLMRLTRKEARTPRESA